MKRVESLERPDWKQLAESLGFVFHSMYGQPYWDESAYYRFTLRQIEDDLEDVSAEIEQMCLALVDEVVEDESLLRQLKIPEVAWDTINESWRRRDACLYGRLDLVYDGQSPAKLYEYNADTPTSLYESAFFQWVWLEQAADQGLLPSACDQFNSIQERLIETLAKHGSSTQLHFACGKGSEEDRGTVRYLQDCAEQAGIKTRFLFMEEIGVDTAGQFVDLDDAHIKQLFKLYPWEWMWVDEFGQHIFQADTQFLEPPWKLILSNKGILPLLWAKHPGHPNLLPAYFEDDPKASALDGNYVRKPYFSREGANVSVIKGHREVGKAIGPYGREGHILQAYHPPPQFDGNHTVIGSWLVANQPCGIGVREDRDPITRDLSRFVPHVILD